MTFGVTTDKPTTLRRGAVFTTNVDGKTYRFLGSQWAELLPSGKTGLFARKKISQELDEITGRKEKKITKKRQKKLEKLDPSAELDAEREAATMAAYDPMQRAGFYGSQVTGLMGGYPAQYTFQQQPTPSPLSTALQAGTGLASIYGNLKLAQALGR